MSKATSKKMGKKTGKKMNKTAGTEKKSFIDSLVQDPRNPPRTKLVRGYLGKSHLRKHVRLYLDPELASYIDIPKKAILHHQPVPAEHSVLGEHFLWLDPEGKISEGRKSGRKSKARFLRKFRTRLESETGDATPTSAATNCATCVAEGCTDDDDDDDD